MGNSEPSLLMYNATKLTVEKAREIRVRFAGGETAQELATAFGVSDQAVKDVVNFETWQSAGGPRREDPAREPRQHNK